jgi:hypothetical protein
MSAEEFAKTINIKTSDCRHGAFWTICPVCSDERASFIVVDVPKGRIEAHCFSGCPKQAVIGAIRALNLWPEYSNFLKVF